MNKSDQLIQARLETTLARYVAMPTVTADVAACQQAIQTLAGELAALGMATYTGNSRHPWLIATANPRAQQTKHVKILFVIHFDVVAPAHKDHFMVKTTADKLYGRGVIDMKFAAAACYEVFKDLAADDTLSAYDAGVLITTDEEAGGKDGAGDFLQQGWRCDLAIVPDGGRNWSVEARAKGVNYIYVVANGLSAHSSRPWEGQSPLQRFSKGMQEIDLHFKNDDPQGLVVAINTIESTNAGIVNSTQTPGWIKAGISMRAFNTAELETGMEFIKSVAKKYDLQIVPSLNDSPVHIMRENPLVEAFIKTLTEVRGKQTEFTDALGASDARHFARQNIPTVLVYPEGGELHGEGEWLKRTDLLTYYKLIQHYLRHVAFNADGLSLGSAKRFTKYRTVFAKMVGLKAK
ncbi:MAG TPA: M20/M25/M40 family metallo-hydrolase [Candidatus Saccharimonas sp.]|nr:M20/M25/M40 family metallo-hydrolase [Candidatus Saccharimonas sp.]